MTRLTGRRPLVTRSAEDALAWAAALTAEGADPIVLPCIRTETIAAPELAERLRAAIADCDWLIFTSRRGVDALADLAIDLPAAGIRFATVGRATADRLRDCFAAVASIDLIGEGTAAMLARELALDPAIGNGARCVLVLAANAGDSLERTLAAAGATVERCDVYRTLPAAPVEPKRPLSSLGCDAVLFASPTAVTGFDNLVDVDFAAQIVTIGPSTSAAVRAHDWQVAAEAREPSLSGIIDSLLETTHV